MLSVRQRLETPTIGTDVRKRRNSAKSKGVKAADLAPRVREASDVESLRFVEGAYLW